jgi:hypothetical protein
MFNAYYLFFILIIQKVVALHLHCPEGDDSRTGVHSEQCDQKVFFWKKHQQGPKNNPIMIFLIT